MNLINHLVSAIYRALRPLPRIERIERMRLHLYQRQQSNHYRGIYDIALDIKLERHTKILEKYYRNEDNALRAAFKELDAEFPLAVELIAEEN
ncbi:MAG: hypothetical protein HC851_22385 [Acaryochloris sp. RU_4_1]|nr:hypothetical protein [Acaryochloris sp. RU_4_1]